jgi:hypothetical protein
VANSGRHRHAPLVVWLLAVLLAVAVGGWLPINGAASADPISSCTPSSGVIVAVDFSHWGGAVQRGCDASPTTGYDALHVAGFTTTGTGRDGPAYICRINGYPTPAEDACRYTPPTSAYWSYWHANPGQNSWSFSSQGAASYHPLPGSVDAWAFGAGGSPTFAPAQVRATQPPAGTPHPSRSVPASSAGAPPAAGGPVVGGAHSSKPASAVPRSVAGRSSAAVAARPSSTSSASSTGPVGSGAVIVRLPSSGSSPRIVDVAPAAQPAPAAGQSPWPVLLTVAVVALLGGGAGWTAWQRRRRTG